MSDKILRALMQLFAIVGKENAGRYGNEAVRFFLRQQLNKELVEKYLSIFEDFLKLQDDSAEGEKKRKRTAVSSVKVILICEQINEELTQKQKTVVLIRLLEFLHTDQVLSEQENEFVVTVASSLNLPEEEYMDCIAFVGDESGSPVRDTIEHMVIDGNPTLPLSKTKHIYAEGLTGEIRILRMKTAGLYLAKYTGNSEIFLNGQAILNEKTYLIIQGSSIRNQKIQPVYYSDIIGRYLSDTINTPISFLANNLEYKFKNGKTGLHPLSFSEKNGKLIGIMGGSGAGKSTLLNILNGNENPSSGEILINGLSLEKDKKELEGIIGYVSQEDLLFDELTVFENLFYNSKLCFAGLSDEKVTGLVNQMLTDLGLFEARDLKAGNPLEKTISGGQRKRLNIALELIREPSILFVDEPTSGLSSRDSENIMDLLKELTLKGKLVFVVIHQPSSEIYKMFDKLLILDQGGYPIYYGNPVEAVIYFKKLTNQVNADESECSQCGNVNPEQIFNTIESKVLDELGNLTVNRKISPAEWNEFYLGGKIGSTFDEPVKKEKPINNFQKPGYFQQFKIFVTRDVLSKLGNTQYLAINLLEAPVLAFILSFLTRYYKTGEQYFFADNKNIPSYIFMSVVVALFIGLTVSAEEIIKDRKILKREAFLNLSRGSYLFSKIFILFSVSAFQTLTFVLIGNYFAGIQGMYSDYWLVLFSTCCFANMLGLNISASFNSAVTIYILIPFLIIPQLLLSGIIVRFDELNPIISSRSVVPPFGEAMTSRWAFEALAVNQFKENEFYKKTYHFEKGLSNANFMKTSWVNKMNEVITLCEGSIQGKDPKFDLDQNIELLRNEILREQNKKHRLIFQGIESLSGKNFTSGTILELRNYLKKIKNYYSGVYNEIVGQKNELMLALQGSNKIAEYNKLGKEHHNEKLDQLVRNKNIMVDDIFEENGKLHPNLDPVFMEGSRDHIIRAHFFAPTKNLFGKSLDTFWVNIVVIWAMSFFLGITLYYDILKKGLRSIGNLFSGRR